MAELFSSYSRKDEGFVLRLNRALEKRDYDAWVNLEDIRPTAEQIPRQFIMDSSPIHRRLLFCWTG